MKRYQVISVHVGMMFLPAFILILSILSGGGCASKDPARSRSSVPFTMEVPGDANIFGSGHTAAPNPGGAGGGTLPPVCSLPAFSNRVLVLTEVTGTVRIDDNEHPQYWNRADGGSLFFTTDVSSHGGIAGLRHDQKTMFLTGVFLDASEPSAPAPARLDFSSTGLSDHFQTLEPQLRQTFFIGDGLTEIGPGGLQRFKIPDGATRLFLGFADSWNGSTITGAPGWYDDNDGKLTARIAVVSDDRIQIVVSPTNRLCRAGDEVSFHVLATGPQPVSYQWFRYGTLLRGEIRPTLTLAPVSAKDEGMYRAVVSDASGRSVRSSSARLVVVPSTIDSAFDFRSERSLETARVSKITNEKLGSLYPVKLLTSPGWKASWAPDGKRIAFGKDGGIVIMNLRSGRTTELVAPGKDPAWSPDGRFIAYVIDGSVEYFSEEVWLISTNGGVPVKLGKGGFPSWSADSRQVLFHSRDRGEILAVRVHEPNAVPTVFFPKALSWYPTISPDGSKIAFGARGQLVIVDRGSSEVLATLPMPGERGLLPAWSPDGKRVAFGGFAGSHAGLWIYDVAKGGAFQIAKDGRCTMPAWSPDGKRLAFDHRGASNEIWSVLMKNLPRKPVLVTRLPDPTATPGDANPLEFKPIGSEKVVTPKSDENAREF